MADIQFILGAMLSNDFALRGIPCAQTDPGIKFGVYSVYQYTILPGERLKSLIIPSSYGMTNAQASGYLVDPSSKNNSSIGLFFMSSFTYNVKEEVNYVSGSRLMGTNLPSNVNLREIYISDKVFENTKFDLFWVQEVGEGAGLVQYFGSFKNTYSFPHNIQYDEITLNGQLVSKGGVPYINYVIHFNDLVNANSVDYTTDNAYKLKVKYTTDIAGTLLVSGFYGFDPIVWDKSINDGFLFYYTPPELVGIHFSLPYYYQASYPRAKIPGAYTVYLNYNSAGTIKPGSLDITIPIDHSSLGTTLGLDDLITSKLNTYVKAENISKVEEIQIRNSESQNRIIDRKRVSVGINDIAIQNNNYKTNGVYISPFYNLDFNMYTFSLRVNEFIPDYPKANKYDVIKYYLELNNNEWIRVSPITRETEYDENSVMVPKLFVFDSSSKDITNDGLKFIETNTNIRSFRIKIVFDLNFMETAQFTPPEVRDYRAVIFDKTQFLDV